MTLRVTSTPREGSGGTTTGDLRPVLPRSPACLLLGCDMSLALLTVLDKQSKRPGNSWSELVYLDVVHYVGCGHNGAVRVCFLWEHLPSPSAWLHSHFLGPTLQVQESYPSLLSHLTSVHLNTPVLALPVVKRQSPDPGLRPFHPLAVSLPCDFHLLNLRSLQAEVSACSLSLGAGAGGLGAAVSPAHRTHAHCPLCCHQEDTLPSLDTALILHRKGFDCGLEAKNLGFNCSTSQGKVSRAGVLRVGRGHAVCQCGWQQARRKCSTLLPGFLEMGENGFFFPSPGRAGAKGELLLKAELLSNREHHKSKKTGRHWVAT